MRCQPPPHFCSNKDFHDCSSGGTWPLLQGGTLPVIVQHLSSLGVDDVDDDASVPPASLEQVVVLVALPGVKGLVQERPGQFLFSVDF